MESGLLFGEMPTISVLMAVYHKDLPLHFSESLDSLRSFLEKIESIIIVADGVLTTELEYVIKTYSKELPIKLIRLEKSRGLGEALNVGLNYAQSTFVLRMDADDICRPERLDVLIDCLIKNPDLDVVGSYIAEFKDSPDKSMYIRRVPLNHSEIMRKMRLRCVMNHVSCIIRRDRLVKVGGYQGGVGFAEDWWLWVRMISCGAKFSNVSNVLVDVRVGNGFIERRRGAFFLKNDLKLIKMMLEVGYINWLHAAIILLSKIVQRLSPPLLLKMIYSAMRY